MTIILQFYSLSDDIMVLINQFVPLHLRPDWPKPVFVIGYATNVMQHASKIYASEVKTEAKSMEHKLIN